MVPKRCVPNLPNHCITGIPAKVGNRPTVGMTRDERSSSYLRCIRETIFIKMQNNNQDGMAFHLCNHMVSEWFQSSTHVVGKGWIISPCSRSGWAPSALPSAREEYPAPGDMEGKNRGNAPCHLHPPYISLSIILAERTMLLSRRACIDGVTM
jgi:hypothetical protein